MEYYYINAPENHYDLADIFGGVYDKEKQCWRVDIQQKAEVLNFMTCPASSSSESETEDLKEYLKANTLKRPKRSRSIHRARSSCTNKSDSYSSVDSDSDSYSSVDLDSDSKDKESLTQKPCDVAETRQAAQAQKVKDLKKLIR